MENIALIGIDLGKNSFHIHCQDHRGKAVYRKKFTRPKLIEFLATCPATTIAMEACGGSHFMARKLAELGKVRISTLRNENETFSQLNSITYIGVFLRLVTYSHLP